VNSPCSNRCRSFHARPQRRQLAAGRIKIAHDARHRRRPVGVDRGGDEIVIAPGDNDEVGHAGRGERVHDGGDERPPAGGGQQRLGPSHARGITGGENNDGKHGSCYRAARDARRAGN
jgi:hypothetical protein